MISEMRVKNLVSTYRRKNLWILNIYDNLNFEFALCSERNNKSKEK